MKGAGRKRIPTGPDHPMSHYGRSVSRRHTSGRSENPGFLSSRTVARVRGRASSAETPTAVAQIREFTLSLRVVTITQAQCAGRIRTDAEAEMLYGEAAAALPTPFGKFPPPAGLRLLPARFLPF